MTEIRNAYKIYSKNLFELMLENLRLGRRIILKWNLKEIRCEGGDWIKLARDRDRWWAVVNTAMNFRVP
jgi:hypothetical protein